ncbi:MAG: GNAT family N-acetyltransferase [Rhodobacteraceae bacterium]|nr:GNAT family N-acetyltransferase [Paracoccaceae bacterium]
MITLAPLPPGRTDLVADIRLPAEQQVFADYPPDVMASAGPGRDGHMILENGTVVGFFAIDRTYADAHDFAEPDTIGLRMFSIDARAQGRGIATAACRALADYLPRHYPDASACYLTVNHRNPRAKAAYLKGGFTDTGEDYLGGGAGPQYIMRLPLA